MKTIPVAILITLLFTSFTFSLDFKYEQKIGRKLRFKNQIIFDIYQNNRLVGSDDQMSKAVLELLSITNGLGKYSAKYTIYNRQKGSDNTYKLLRIFDTSFYQDDRGKMIVSPKDIIPSTRSIPTFPASSLEPGDHWKAAGEEILENVFNSNQNYKIPVDVDYNYLSNVIVKDKKLAVFTVDYNIYYHDPHDETLESIDGATHNLFYWDIETAAPYYYSEEINLLYTGKDRQAILYKGNSASIVEDVTDITNTEKTSLMKELSNQISNPTNGMNVRETNDGIIVSLGNILFDINKYTIKQDYELKLKTLAGILNKHPNLDIVVSGHTDNTGTNPYNTELSENRARAITDYLVSEGVSRTRISFVGYGPDRPIADNGTSEGRALNRRVEVKIITRE